MRKLSRFWLFPLSPNKHKVTLLGDKDRAEHSQMLYPRHGVQRFGYSLWSLQMQHAQHELFNQHLSNKGDETCVSMRHVEEHMGCRMPQRLGHEANGFVRKPAAVRSLLIFIDSFHTSWPPSWPHLERRLEVFACFFVRSCLGWHFVAFISSSDCIQVWVWLSIDSSWGVQGQESQHWLLLSFLRQLQGKRHRPHKAAGGCWRHGCILLLSCKQLFVKILDFLCARQVVTYLKP